MSSVRLFAQDEESESSDETKNNSSGLVFKPIIGMGVGMFSFYGDIGQGNKYKNPLVSKLGYDLRVTQPITPHFDMYFHVLFGKLGANERSADRNLNFESTIRLGGIGINYNFHHLLSEQRVIDPYITLGIESFEFLSKTDLYDAYGNKYHYWSDGSIRNMDENDPNAAQDAIHITRDYYYESDIRELNEDGFGKYAERSIAIPVGIGANLYVTDRIRFRVGTSMHFTFTNYIDGVTEQSVGNRKGNDKNDKFLFTSFNLNYSLNAVQSDDYLDDNNADFLAIDLGDEDQDGVNDFKDKCPHTPLGVAVDENGCPLDADGDGVPDYKDQEADTPDSLFADMDGIGLTPERLEEIYQMYMDSTGAFAKISKDAFTSEKKKKKFMVQIGQRTDALSADLVDIILSVPDIRTVQQGDSTIFVVGNYDNLPEAIRRALELGEQGMPGTSVLAQEDGGSATKVSDNDIASASQGTSGSSEPTKGTAGGEESLIFRIQLGAYSKPLSQDIFSGIPGLVVLTSDDGITRYYTGAFDNYNDAATHKINMISEGFADAFVVPLKGGKKVPLSSTGKATPVSKNTDIDKTSQVSVKGKEVKFKVQLGAYSEQIPINVLENFMKLGNVEQRKKDGITKYVVGEFTNLNDAKKFKQEMIDKGIEGAFVVGEFNGNLISVEEAIELQKK
jgi:hypothetical protein